MIDYKENYAQTETLYDMCNNRPSTINCEVNQNDPNVKISNFFDDYEWYKTYHANRKNLKGRLDCYRTHTSSNEITYVCFF